MITEDGSIKTARISVAPALGLYRKKLKLISIILLIVGVIGSAVYIVLGTVLGGENEDAPKWVEVFLVFAIPLALGLIGYIVLQRLGKRESKAGATSECVFYADCFFCSTKSAIQSETLDKISYSESVLKRENENYGYIVTKKGLFLVFGKEGLEDRELNTIRKLFDKPVSSDTVELKNYKPNEDKQ